VTLLMSRFSALQRAEIAEILRLRWWCASGTPSFSALQRAEIAEMQAVRIVAHTGTVTFQCSSTSRNC